MAIMPPQPRLGTFQFWCLRCFKKWEEVGFEDGRVMRKGKVENVLKTVTACPRCGGEIVLKDFKILDPDADIDAT